jgi:D-xylonolactonase
MAPTPTVVARTRDRLGESPQWHAGEGAIYWTDLYGPTIHRLQPGDDVQSWTVPGTSFIGSLVFVRGGWLLLAIDTGLVLFNPKTATFTPFGDPNEGREGIVYNDSKIDRAGRLWVGTLDLAEAEPRGILYCVDTLGRTQVGDSGFTVCNGPAFSPAGDVLYFSDSIGRRLLAYDVTPGTPPLRNRRVFASMGPDDGVPDGLTVDADGGVWCAHYGAGRLTRYAPDGSVLMVLHVPCPVVTSMSFGGPDLTTLFVTTGWTLGITRAEDEQGSGGSLLSYDVGIRGLAEPEFALSMI